MRHRLDDLEIAAKFGCPFPHGIEAHPTRPARAQPDTVVGDLQRQGTVPVQLGVDGFLGGWPTFVFVAGLLLIIVLWVRKVRGAILIAIVATTVLAIVIDSLIMLAGKAMTPWARATSVPRAARVRTAAGAPA